MATQVQIRGAAQATQESRTLAARELDVNTTDDRIVIHDGSTSGGIPHINYKDQINQEYTYAAATGTDSIAMTLAIAPAAYAAGQKFVFKAANTNTGSATLNVNSLGAKTLKKKDVSGGTIATLAAGDIIQGGVYTAFYDGTDMVLESVDAGGGSTDWTEVKVTPSGDTDTIVTGITSGTSEIIGYITALGQGNSVQEMHFELGDSGGYETSGYVNNATLFDDDATVDTNDSFTGGFLINDSNVLAAQGNQTYTGEFRITRVKSDENLWMYYGMYGTDTTYTTIVYGNKTLSGELTQIQIDSTNTNGAFTGTVYLKYR